VDDVSGIKVLVLLVARKGCYGTALQLSGGLRIGWQTFVLDDRTKYTVDGLT